MGVPETDPLAQLRCRRLELKDSAKMQRAEPPPPPQTVTVLLVAIDGDTQSRIIDQLPPPHYQLVASSTPNLALHLLVDEKLHVDLVLSSVSSKDDEDGYNFITQVQRLRKNIPHVVIFEAEGSGDPEIIRVNKLGVCYILWKPVSEQSSEIKNLRQHVFRRNEGSSSLVSFPQKSLKKENDQQPSEKEPESSKKQRMVWDKELNTLFVKAVNELGDDAGPKRILEFMNQKSMREQVGRLTREKVESLTKEQVGSHLQKYKEKEKKKELHQTRNLQQIKINQI